MQNLKINDIQLIVMDCDGTIYNENNGLEKGLVTKLQSLNIPYTLASGRNYEIIKDIARELNIKLPMILNNGASLKEVSGKSLYRNPIEDNDLGKIIQYCKEYNIGCILYTDGKVYMQELSNEVSKFYHKRLKNKMEKYPLEEYRDEPIEKIVVFKDNEDWTIDVDIQNLCKYTTCTASEGSLYMIGHKSSTKGIALKLLANRLNIPLDSILVFGDDYNDIDMFQSVGHSVVKKHAKDEVKKHAKMECDSVVEFLNNFIS